MLRSGEKEPAQRVQRRFKPDWLAVGAPLVLVAGLAIPHLPPGICFGDSGDLQVAAATLTMAHPPGYGGFASVGHILTLIPGLEPAYAVTLGCLASGLIALGFIAALQIRLGASPGVAAAVTLALAGSTRIWEALVIPEVYAANLALHGAAIWLLITYLRTGRRSPLVLMALLLGFAIANRPSALLSVPGFAAALAIHWWQTRPAARKWLSATGVAAAILLLPSVYTLGYYFVRDSSETPVNMIENRRITHGDLPPATAGPAARMERILWLATARDFRGLVGGSGTFMAGRARWMIERLGLSNDFAMVAVTCATVIGGAIAWRRCRALAAALIGVGLGAVIFFCAYAAYDTAADVLPIMFTASVFVGLCVSRLFSAKSLFGVRALLLLLVVAGVYVKLRAGETIPDTAALDATQFAPAAELRSLPQKAAVFSNWEGAAPLRYAQHRLGRGDLLIVAVPIRVRELAARLSDEGRGVFSVTRFAPPDGYELARCEALWHTMPISGEVGGAAPERSNGVSEGGEEHQGEQD